jgi:Aspartyl protease
MGFFAHVAVLALFLAVSAHSETPNEIRFQYQDGLIWLKAKVPGKTTSLNFLLDSGAGVSVIDLEQARALGMRIRDPESVQGVSGRAVAYRVDDFQANSGGVALPKSVLAINLQAISQRCHQHIDGILGMDFFRGRIVQIDFAARRVRIVERDSQGLADCEILPIKICNDAFCVPVRVAENPAQWIRVDTGCDACLEWVVSDPGKRLTEGTSVGLSHSSRRRERRPRISAPGVHGDPGVDGVMTTVQIGKQRFAVAAAVHEKPMFSGEAGLLGNGLLSKFCLTIDEPGNRVIFERKR